MNKLTLKEHGSWIKQMLQKKSLMDTRERGKEIQFEKPVLNAMQRYGFSKEIVHQFIRDFPLESLTPLNAAFGQYLFGVYGTYGRHMIRIELKMHLDRSGFDVTATNMVVKQ